MPSRTVHAVCSHDCPDSCGVLVTIDETGQATKLRGDPNHPVTRGFLCGKVAKYLDRVYSPDRLLYPMRRRAGVPKTSLPHGQESEAFERISWDEALSTVATRLAAIASEHGPESILPYSYAGTIGILNYGSMDRRFFHRLGASQLDRTICSETGGQALISVYGRKLGTDTEAFSQAKLIIAWAATSTATTSISGPSSKKRGAMAQSSSSSTPTPPAPLAPRTGTSPSIPAPTPRSRLA